MLHIYDWHTNQKMKIPYIPWGTQCRKKVALKLRLTSVRAGHSKLRGLRVKSARALKPADIFDPIVVECVRVWPEYMLERYSFLRGKKS